MLNHAEHGTGFWGLQVFAQIGQLCLLCCRAVKMCHFPCVYEAMKVTSYHVNSSVISFTVFFMFYYKRGGGVILRRSTKTDGVKQTEQERGKTVADHVPAPLNLF